MPRFVYNRRNVIILGALLVFHLILLSLQTPLQSEKSLFEKVVFGITAPVVRGAKAIGNGVVSFWDRYIDLRRIRADNRALSRDLFFANQEIRFLAERLAVYEAADKMQESLEEFRNSLVVARVIGIDFANYYNSVIIDKGLYQGVRRDMAVCDKFGHLVGRIVPPTNFHEAHVQLITDEQCRVSVVSEKSRVVGILRGTSGELCLLDHILATVQDLNEGEDLITTGFDGIFPPGLRVGRILSIEEDRDRPLFKYIVVHPYFQFSGLEAVAVFAKSGEEGE